MSSWIFCSSWILIGLIEYIHQKDRYFGIYGRQHNKISQREHSSHSVTWMNQTCAVTVVNMSNTLIWLLLLHQSFPSLINTNQDETRAALSLLAVCVNLTRIAKPCCIFMQGISACIIVLHVVIPIYCLFNPSKFPRSQSLVFLHPSFLPQTLRQSALLHGSLESPTLLCGHGRGQLLTSRLGWKR